MAALPLKYRLANPPTIFVGRARELEMTVAAIRRGPVTVVTGPGGIGKTALVLEAVHRHLAPDATLKLMIAVGRDEPAAQVRLEILRALAVATGHRVADWAELQRDPDRATALVLDLAESATAWVVVDDVHHADGDELASLLASLARYGRASRFIATSRPSLGLRELVSQEIPLDLMDEDALLDLARQTRPGERSDRVREAVHAAKGSPWLLHQFLAAGVAGVAVSRAQLVEGVPEEGIRLLEALAMLSLPLGEESLRTLSLAPSEELVATLVRRGLLCSTPSGLAVHDAVRAILGKPSSEHVAWALRAADTLIASGEPDALFEGLRLKLALGEPEKAVMLVQRAGEELVRDGYAARLWKIISDAPDERLDPWRMRCAAELGNPTALAQVGEPASADPREQLAWALARLAQGDLSTAERVASAIGEGARSTDVALFREATILRARCLGREGRISAAREALGEPALAHETTATRREALDLRLAAEVGEPSALDRTLRFIDELRAAPLAADAIVDAAHAARTLGASKEAADLVGALRATPRGSHSELLTARHGLLLDASLRLSRGSLDAAADLVAEMDRYVRGPSLLRPLVGVLRAKIAIARGDVAALTDRMSGLIAEAQRSDASLAIEAMAALAELRTLRGEPPSSDGLRIADELLSGPPARELMLRQLLQRRRHGLPAPAREVALARTDASAGRVGVLAGLALATEALLSDRAAEAVVLGGDTAQHAVRARERILAAEALELTCDAIVCTEARGELSRRVAELASLASEIGSPRFVGSSELFGALAEGSVSMERVERCAAMRSSPVASRRARVLLGEISELDRVDGAVIARERARGGVGKVETLGVSDASAPAWGLDRRHQRVWTADGRSIDLAATPLLFRILDVLAAHGGRATKEELVRQAWGETDYHKLNDKGRVHVALRKLRELIEDDPSSPTRVLTIEGAYAMGGVVRTRD